jgi:hypothetical protein
VSGCGRFNHVWLCERGGGVVSTHREDDFQVTMWARDIVRILLKSALGVFEGVRGSGGVRVWQLR